jgi:hypothetical protein
VCDAELKEMRAVPVHKNLEKTRIEPPLARRRLAECPFQLTGAEKKLLKDPDWIDEDEADLILAIRAEKRYGLKGENIRDFARRYGRDLKG